MEFLKKIWLFLGLFFHINCNLFFEKYKFIKLKRERKNLFFVIWYVLKNHILVIVGILLLDKFFNSDTLNMVVVSLIILSILVKTDAKDWRLFYRTDFVCEIPDVKKRFFTVMLSNVSINLFVEDNILILFSFFIFYSHISWSYLPLLIMAFTIIYMASSSIYFMIQNSSIKIRKIFSLFSYVTSMISMTVVVYVSIDYIISVFLLFKENLRSKMILPHFVTQGSNTAKRVIGFVSENINTIVIVLFAYVLLIIIGSIITLKYLDKLKYTGRDDKVYTIDSFILVKLIRKITKIMYGDGVAAQFINKELALFSDTYKYNFRDYFSVFVSGKSVAMFSAITAVLLNFQYSGTYLIMFIFAQIIVLLDVNSCVSVNLVVNMSFIGEYSTLLTMNSSGQNISQLVKSKIKFYYLIRIFAHTLLFVFINIGFSLVSMPIYLMLIGNIMAVGILILYVRAYFINNLIYTRINYRDYTKYLDESQLLEEGVPEFFILNLLMSIWFLILIATLLITSIVHTININVMAMIDIILLIALIIGGYIIMNKIGNNIIRFIKGGDYSADFAKIFKK